VAEFARPYVDNFEKSVPNLWNHALLPGVGHWTDQGAPAEANGLMVEFLAGVDDKGKANRRLHLHISPADHPVTRWRSCPVQSDTTLKRHGRLDAIRIGLLDVSAVALLASASSGNIIGRSVQSAISRKGRASASFVNVRKLFDRSRSTRI
jgi:hypothetical protein